MDSGEVAAWLLDHLCVHYGANLRARYGKDLPLDESVATLEAIGRVRGCLGGGGLVDFDRAGRLLLSEYRGGLLGGITLETPAMQQVEQAATAKRLAEIEAKREERKQKKSAERDARRARSKSDKGR